MRDKLPETIRIGKISAIFPDRCTAEVTFEDRADIVTRELFIIIPYTLKDRAYYMPSVQERVLCVFDPGAPSIGYILGSFYCDTRIPPLKDENKTYINFEDETLIEYDKKDHTLTVKIPESGEMSINVETASHINVVCKKDINIDANGKITLRSDGDIRIESGTHIWIEAPEVDINDKFPD